MARVYIYVLKYDFGFAPNPFGGVCTFACCKPVIRRTAKVGDWMVGVGGSSLKATGRCIFAMQVTGALSFEEYWLSPVYRTKRPKRNGSRQSMVGDNIYWHDPVTGAWRQEDSIHSRPDSLQDVPNTEHDTGVDRVLVSERFIYFGAAAPAIPEMVLSSIGYRNRRGHSVYELSECAELLNWIFGQSAGTMNRVVAKPFQFHLGNRRYSRVADRIV